MVSRPLGFSYKYVNGRWATRVEYNYRYIEASDIMVDAPYILPDGKIQTIGYFGSTRQNTFRLGREYRIPLKHRIQLVLGADIQCRYVNFSSSFSSSIAQVDSVISPGTSAQQTQYKQIDHYLLERTSMNSWQYGIGLSGGFLIPMGARWWLNSTIRLDSFYGFYNSTTYNQSGFVTNKSRNSYFHVNPSWFISELSVFYRF